MSFDPKVNGLDLGSGLGPKVNGFGPNRLGWAEEVGLVLGSGLDPNKLG